MVDVLDVTQVDSRNAAMEQLGYECMGEFGIEGRRYFRKDDKDGMRTHHIHVFESESSHLVRHLAFRDYLIEKKDIAQEYSDLKQQLALRNPQSMEAYIAGKSPFIKRIEQEALEWWRLKRGQRK